MGQKRVFLLLAGSLFAVSLLAVGLTLSRVVHREACAAPIQRKNVPKNLEGIEVVGDQLKVKSGYKFVKLSRSKGVIQRINSGLNTVIIECSCKSEQGGCDEQLIGDVVRCQPTGECTSCDKIITVPQPQGLKPGVLR